MDSILNKSPLIFSIFSNNKKSELTQPYTTVSQMLLKITPKKLVTVLIPHLDHIHKNSEFHHQGFGWQKD